MASPRTQTANAIAAIQARGHHPELPEIDFTQHQLENGDVVSTTERVVKDVSVWASRWEVYCAETVGEGVVTMLGLPFIWADSWARPL